MDADKSIFIKRTDILDNLWKSRRQYSLRSQAKEDKCEIELTNRFIVQSNKV